MTAGFVRLPDQSRLNVSEIRMLLRFISSFAWCLVGWTSPACDIRSNAGLPPICFKFAVFPTSTSVFRLPILQGSYKCIYEEVLSAEQAAVAPVPLMRRLIDQVFISEGWPQLEACGIMHHPVFNDYKDDTSTMAKETVTSAGKVVSVHTTKRCSCPLQTCPAKARLILVEQGKFALMVINMIMMCHLMLEPGQL